MADRVKGLKAVVTGSGGKMGGACAVKLASEGADVVLNDRLAGLTIPWEKKLKEIGVDVVSVLANVTRREGAEQVINTALERWGRVDLLLNIVGGIKGNINNPIWSITEEEWEYCMGLNLRGCFHCTQLAVPGMMERKFGKIVNISSTSWAGDPTHAHYAAAKAGVVAFTRSVATQLGPYNINVNCIGPGGTTTDQRGHEEEKEARQNQGDDYTGRNPLGRPNHPDDIANGALFLCSEEARNISGQLLMVASGLNPHL